MKFEIFEKIKAVGFIPELAVSFAGDAIFLSLSLIKGNLPAITLKGEQAFEAIGEIKKCYPKLIVGACSINDQASIEKAIAYGAQYIVLNCCDKELLDFCAKQNYAVIPAVSTASELAMVQNLGFELVNFFPCTKDLDAFDALSKEFPSMHFLLSGSIDKATAFKALLNPKVAAVMGDFMIDEQSFCERKQDLVAESVNGTILSYLNFHIAHMGMNANSKDESVAMASRLASVINRKVREGKKSAFAGKLFEIMYSPFYYEKGHVALGSSDATRAYHYLKRCGVEFIEDSISYDANGRVIAGYMKENFGGFGIHLLQVAPDFYSTI